VEQRMAVEAVMGVTPQPPPPDRYWLCGYCQAVVDESRGDCHVCGAPRHAEKSEDVEPDPALSNPFILSPDKPLP